MTFELLDFQGTAVDQLRESIAEWAQAVKTRGQPPLTVDGEPIPLLAHVTAITGAGKTPILASVIGGVGPGVVIWTSNRSVVVDQTAVNLATRYRHFLPAKTTIIADKPTQDQWNLVLNGQDELVILCMTVGSWNAVSPTSGGKERLNFRRPAADWAGATSPWTQLAQLADRPLWIVYDEGHGQTENQLDQLLELNPVGIIAASGTPRFSPRLEQLRTTLDASQTFGPIAAKSMVEVPTEKVARAGLLKAHVELVDLNMENESQIQAVVAKLAELDVLSQRSGADVRPIAIYVTEQSDSTTAEPRPVTIWKILTEKLGVQPNTIALSTQTKEIPHDAERVVELAQLKPRHRHIIFNKKFQEGWDQPEAYIAYFDGETGSTLRLKQVIGRVIRQPNGAHFQEADLNTAYLYVSSPDVKFAAIVASLKKSLAQEYGSDEFGEPNVTVGLKSEKPGPIELRSDLPDLSLPNWVLAGRDIDSLFAVIRSAGERMFPVVDLEAAGQARRITFSLTDTQSAMVDRMASIGRHIRSLNKDYFMERVRILSREAEARLPEQILAGPMFAQTSAALSPAQVELSRLANEYVDGFESRARFDPNPRKKDALWRPTSFRPSRAGGVAYARSIHPVYPDSPAFLNKDEKEMAQALDGMNGWWERNPPSKAQGGYGLTMPVQVGGSQSFFPDFLWWIDDGCWAIDTTGVHILGPKVRGKLLTLADPRIALVTRGKVMSSFDSVEDTKGWTLTLPGPSGASRDYYPDLPALLSAMRST